MSTKKRTSPPVSSSSDRKIKVGDIGEYLGVGWRVVRRLLKEGKIKPISDPLDNRRKLVSTKDLDQLKDTSMSRRKRK